MHRSPKALGFRARLRRESPTVLVLRFDTGWDASRALLERLTVRHAEVGVGFVHEDESEFAFER